MAMSTELTGVMTDELIEQLQQIAQTFKGKTVRIVIQESNGDERKPRGRRES